MIKKNNLIRMAILALAIFILPHSINAQDKEETEKLLSDSKDAKSKFIKADTSMGKLFENSYGYVIFPKIGKGGFIVGGSGGDGTVYEKGKEVGTAKMGQVTVGAQIGGQSYREVIFFENEDALNRFKYNKLEFSGQVSAVAVRSGASKNAKYTEGVAVFTQDIGGLMAEATVGGQKFTYKAL
jgi:lipid-binding SYLF domain-containing protein